MKKFLPNAFIAGIVLVSAGAIALELAVMRVMLIAYWHHLYYLVISTALLGFGAAGTFLALMGHRITDRHEWMCWFFALLFGITTVLSCEIISLIPLNMLHLAWNPGQIVYLVCQYLTLFVPFFFGACCIGTAFIARPAIIGKLYGANMIGSGLGAVGVVFLMYVLEAQWLGVAISVVVCGASGLMGTNRKHLIISITALLGVLLVSIGIWQPRQRISQYKSLSYYRQLSDARVLAVRHSPLGRIDVIQSDQIHMLPGRSLVGTTSLPEQAVMIIDGDAVSAMTRFDEVSELACFDEVSLALPYHVLTQPETLIVGAGAGFDVGLALYHKCRQIVALELNPDVIELAQSEFSDLAGDVYSRPSVEVVVADARGYLQYSDRQFDLIQIPPLDSFGSVAAGVHALNESYLYTTEALGLYLEHLRPGGIVCLTRWVRYWPGRDGIKLLGTAIEAIRQGGLQGPGRYFIAIRSWATITVMISNRAFTPEQINNVKEFCRIRQFDMVYLPGLTGEQANIYHVLHDVEEGLRGKERAVYFQAVGQLLDPTKSQDFYDTNLCQVIPATDDRPYFHDFFRWRSLPRLRQVLGDNWMPFIDWGYLILILALLQSIVLGVVCILLPLLFRRTALGGKGYRLITLSYFGAIGFGYMMLEMSFIQRLALFLSHPIAAVAVVLTAFLIFSGLGSIISQYLHDRSRQVIILSALGICVIGVVYLLCWSSIIAPFAGLSLMGRCAVGVLLAAPMAFLMGMPFPMGLRQLSLRGGELTAWAWGINCFASVVATSLAVCIAISYGHRVVMAIAIVLYLFVAVLSKKSFSAENLKTDREVFK